MSVITTDDTENAEKDSFDEEFDVTDDHETDAANDACPFSHTCAYTI